MPPNQVDKELNSANLFMVGSYQIDPLVCQEDSSSKDCQLSVCLKDMFPIVSS